MPRFVKMKVFKSIETYLCYNVITTEVTAVRAVSAESRTKAFWYNYRADSASM